MKLSAADYLSKLAKQHLSVLAEVDTLAASERIKKSIWFKGPTVWILAFSIIIASVGLNVNSTAVIIGAMLISPLMGPIIGCGFALGTNDLDLLRQAARNLVIMVVISLVASTLYFMMSPLSLANPTELEARTSPTIYDVMIALFGGLAGILENSRKEQGTTIAGVAIATALMPPLCTAGYGLAHFNMHFFLGALYLFIINSVFIALATYLMVKVLRFKTVSGLDPTTSKKRRNLISAVLTIVLVPSIWSAFVLIRENNFERNVVAFIQENQMVGRSYIYDYDIDGRDVTFCFAGDPLSDSLKAGFYANAAEFHLKESQITIKEHRLGLSQAEMDQLINDVYDRTDAEISENMSQLSSLQSRMDELSMQFSVMSDSLLRQNDSLRMQNASLQERVDSLVLASRPRRWRK